MEGMAEATPALFLAFPSLEGRLARCPFLGGPTPVERLPLAEAPGADLFVKRDDRSCPLYGGNKPRKLEFVIGAALERGCGRLVTTGALGTNHGLATTILGGAAGLATTLVLVDQPVTDEVREKLLFQAAWGAEQVYGRNVPGAVVQTARILARSGLRGERPFLISTGGSSSRGNAGFVSAGLELARQVGAGELPEPEEIYLPVGSGGSYAGLVVGLRLASLDTPVRGVLVSDILPPSPARLARLARRTLRRLRRLAPEMPLLRLGAADFPLLRDQVGPGYGAETAGAREALEAAAGRGLRLDGTYTAKCMAEVIARARRGALARGPVLFWNTYSSVDLAASVPRPATTESLPRALRRFW
jgi:D-cysteine desulfhydrase